jgi:hypothetical protein
MKPIDWLLEVERVCISTDKNGRPDWGGSLEYHKYVEESRLRGDDPKTAVASVVAAGLAMLKPVGMTK